MRPSIHGPVRRATAKPGRQPGYRLRVAWEPGWPRDPRHEAKCQARARAAQRRARVLRSAIGIGALLGATMAAWHGFEWYGPNGIPAGLILGSLGGALAGFLALLLLLLLIPLALITAGVLLLGS